MLLDAIILGLLLGALCGVAPLVLGKFLGRPGLGMLGLLCSAFAGALLSLWAAILVAVAFSIVILAAKQDVATAANIGQPALNKVPQIMCMSGPLQGHVYNITADGLILGRDQCCSLRLPGSAAGISRRHCRIRLQGGRPVLEDLQSSYGTFLATGQRLVPNSPVYLTNGSRFYLGDRRNQFQITI